MAEREFSRAQACCAHRARTAGATAGSLRITAQRRAEREDWDEKLDSDGSKHIARGDKSKHIAREQRNGARARRSHAVTLRRGAGRTGASVRDLRAIATSTLGHLCIGWSTRDCEKSRATSALSDSKFRTADLELV